MCLERPSDVVVSILGINIERWCGVDGVHTAILQKERKLNVRRNGGGREEKGKEETLLT